LLAGHFLCCEQLRKASEKRRSRSTNATSLAGKWQGRGIPGRAIRCTLKIVWKLAKRVN
jgi:hypothetical protein